MEANFYQPNDLINSLVKLHKVQEAFENLSKLQIDQSTGIIYLADGTMRSVTNIAEEFNKIDLSYQDALLQIIKHTKDLEMTFPQGLFTLQHEINEFQSSFDNQTGHFMEFGNTINHPELAQKFITDIQNYTFTALKIIETRIPVEMRPEDISSDVEETPIAQPLRPLPALPILQPTRARPFPEATAAKAYELIDKFAVEESHTAETLKTIAETIHYLIEYNQTNNIFLEGDMKILELGGEIFFRAFFLSSQLSMQCNSCLREEGNFDFEQFCNIFHHNEISNYSSYTQALKEVIQLVKPLAEIIGNPTYSTIIADALGKPEQELPAWRLQQSVYELAMRAGRQATALEEIRSTNPHDRSIIAALEEVKAAATEINDAL